MLIYRRDGDQLYHTLSDSYFASQKPKTGRFNQADKPFVKLLQADLDAKAVSVNPSSNTGVSWAARASGRTTWVLEPCQAASRKLLGHASGMRCTSVKRASPPAKPLGGTKPASSWEDAEVEFFSDLGAGEGWSIPAGDNMIGAEVPQCLILH